MKLRDLVVGVVLVLVLSTGALADTVDLGLSFHKLYSITVDMTPDQVSDIAFVLNYSLLNHSAEKTQGKPGEELGAYRILEGHKSSNLIGLGYRAGIFTPWVGLSSQTAKKTKYETVLKDEQDKAKGFKENKTDATKTLTGAALGINVETWFDNFGVAGTIAKIPEGFLVDGKVRYKVAEIGTVHLGFNYNSHLQLAITAGIGLSY